MRSAPHRIGILVGLAPALVLLAIPVTRGPQRERVPYVSPGGMRVTVPILERMPDEPPAVGWPGADSCTVFVGYTSDQLEYVRVLGVMGTVVDLCRRRVLREARDEDEPSYLRRLAGSLPDRWVMRASVIGLTIPVPQPSLSPGAGGVWWQPHQWGYQTVTAIRGDHSRVLLHAWVWNSTAGAMTARLLRDLPDTRVGFITRVNRTWVVWLWPDGVGPRGDAAAAFPPRRVSPR